MIIKASESVEKHHKILVPEYRAKAKALFGDWDETIIASCLQGVMGDIYLNEQMNAAAAVLGDFCFFAGEPCEELVKNGFGKTFLIMTPQNADWGRAIEAVYGENAHPTVRYAVKKEKNCFDIDKLKGFIDLLPREYRLSRIDRELYKSCKENAWSKDFVKLFDTADDFEQLGRGIVAIYEGEIVAGASSYSRYEEGIEIEVDTRSDFRRRGLATACCAALICDCCESGLYPSWDAQNLWSLALAEKLGYSFSHQYSAYEVTIEPNTQ